MTCSPQFHIPGSFIPDAPPPLNTHVPSGVHPGVFRPPVSPSPASSSFLGKSSLSESSTPTLHSKRKRMDEERDNTPEWRMGGIGMVQSRWFESAGDFGTTPGREVRYTLAGQIDTPGGTATPGGGDGILDESVYSDVDYRRALGPKQDVMTPGFAMTEAQSPGWGQFALGAIGGVVGRVWEFCKGGAFRGFHAGGGTGYSFQGASESPMYPTSAERPQLPGGFPSTDSMAAYLDPIPDATPTRPSAKRRQVSEANDDLRRNWVMVEDPQNQKRRPAPSRRTSTRASTASSRRINVPMSRLNSSSGPNLARRHSHRVSYAGSPALTNREPASFASPRSPRPSSPALSQSRIPVPSPKPTVRSSRQSGIASPIQSSFNTHRRTHSGASSASTRTKPKERLDVDDIEASPRLDVEAKRLAARKLLEEEDADARISAFNARLRDMIRQGKEALGTKVEVSMEEGGWSDEE